MQEDFKNNIGDHAQQHFAEDVKASESSIVADKKGVSHSNKVMADIVDNSISYEERRRRKAEAAIEAKGEAVIEAEAKPKAEAEVETASEKVPRSLKVMVNNVDNSISYEEHLRRRAEAAIKVKAEAVIEAEAKPKAEAEVETASEKVPRSLKVMVNNVDNSISYEEHLRRKAEAAIESATATDVTSVMGAESTRPAAAGIQGIPSREEYAGYTPLPMYANTTPSYYEYNNLMWVNGYSRNGEGWLQYGGTMLMNCTVRICRTVESGKKSYYKCSVLLNGEQVQRDVPVEEFAQGKWLPELAGFILLGKKKDMKKYLNLVVMADGRANRAVELDKPGWCLVNGAHLYATPEGSIPLLGVVSVTSTRGQRFMNRTDNQKDTLCAFLEMIKLTPKSWVAPILLLQTVVGFLYSLFKLAGWTPRFVLFLQGATGAMKTSLTSALTQVECTSNPKYPLSSTLAALEGAYSEYKDAVALFDDLKPGNDRAEQNELRHNFEAILRAYGDANGRQRNRDFHPNLGQYEAEGGAVMTGEFLPSHGSSLARLLILPLKRGDVDMELLSNVQLRPRLAPFMCAFLSYVAVNHDALVQYISACGNAHRQELLTFSFAHDRYRYDQVVLMTAIDVLVKYGNDTNQWTPPMDAIARFLRENVRQCIAYNTNQYMADRPETILCKAIVEGVSSGTPEVIPVGTVVRTKGDVVFSDELSFYVLPSTVLAWHNRYIVKNGVTSLRYSTTEIGNTLESCEVLQPTKEGATLRRAARFPGCGTKRYFKLNREILNRIAEGCG